MREVIFSCWVNPSLWVVRRGRISEFIRESLEVDGMEVDEKKGFCGLPRFVEGEDEGERESASHASHSDDATTPPNLRRRLYCTAFNNCHIAFAK